MKWIKKMFSNKEEKNTLVECWRCGGDTLYLFLSCDSCAKYGPYAYDLGEEIEKARIKKFITGKEYVKLMDKWMIDAKKKMRKELGLK